MRNKETLFVIIFLLVTFLAFYGCGTQKKAVKEQRTEQHTNIVEKSEDESIIDYLIDTTHIYVNEVVFVKTEFLPYFDSATHKQPIKAINTATIKKKQQKSGVSVVHIDSVKHDSINLVTEQQTETKQATEKTKPFTFQWWWLLLLALFIVGIYARFKYIK